MSAASGFVVLFEGRRLAGLRGQSVAAVLLAHDVRDWRTSVVRGRPRGLFCGIGICFDCVVTLDGQRDVRACLARPQGDVEVRRQAPTEQRGEA